MTPITNHMVCPDIMEPCTTLRPWRIHNAPIATNTIPTIALSQRNIRQSFRTFTSVLYSTRLWIERM